MNSAASDLNRCAYLASVRMLYGRTPADIVADLNGCARILAHELEHWSSARPLATALVTAETTVDGLRRLLGQLRVALDAQQGRLDR